MSLISCHSIAFDSSSLDEEDLVEQTFDHKRKSKMLLKQMRYFSALINPQLLLLVSSWLSNESEAVNYVDYSSGESDSLVLSVQQPVRATNGVCGNSRYDHTANDSVDIPEPDIVSTDGSGRISIEHFSTLAWRESPINRRKFAEKMGGVYLRQEEAMRNRLRNELLVVRLCIFYDTTLAREFKSQQEIEKLVRNIVFQVQLIYQQSEIYGSFKLNFVVVKLAPSQATYQPHLHADAILSTFSKGPDQAQFGQADINLLLTFSNLWVRYVGKNTLSVILGIANVGTFCRADKAAAIVVSARSLSIGVTIAHELGHAFNSQHDDLQAIQEKYRCDSRNSIMAAELGGDSLWWSNCTVNAILDNFVSDTEVSKCLYEPARVASAKPISAYFDFTPGEANKQNLNNLPGTDFAIDDQCKMAIDDAAISALTYMEKSYQPGLTKSGNCRELMCVVDDYVVLVGQALTGTKCTIQSGTFGRCFLGSCVAH